MSNKLEIFKWVNIYGVLEVYSIMLNDTCYYVLKDNKHLYVYTALIEEIKKDLMKFEWKKEFDVEKSKIVESIVFDNSEKMYQIFAKNEQEFFDGCLKVYESGGVA